MFSGMENHVNEDFLSSYMIVNCTIICMYEGNNEIIYKKRILLQRNQAEITCH